MGSRRAEGRIAVVAPTGTDDGCTCTIKVTYTGHKIGIHDAVLVIKVNVGSGVLKIPTRARVNKPTVESNPAVSPVRRVVTITGKGYAPNHQVDIGFDGNKQMAFVTKPDGSFVVQMVILPNGPQGPRMLFARSTGLDASISDDFPFLVALGSTDPGLVVKRDG